jgi:outer membrane protein assembly factor BamD (BamD/ComL family)
VVGAVIEPTSSEMSDKELQRRLDQLYTDGLAAFYTEDWAKACFCFQTILSEQPSYRSAAEKLAEAEWERKLARLYARSSEALQIENWQVALETLEELVQKSPDYKDAAQLLRDAKKREQLRRLYAEARALHAAQKWQAVVMVFGQISVLEPNFPDPEGLLATAEKETAEAERQAGLKELYGQALREMDSGNWHQARKLLEQVRRSQTGFLETERLLRKVEAEEEIEKLQNHFEDEDGIAQQARAELEREGNGAQRQNQLAGRYAEAVRLLKEEKYQEALDQWHEIEAIDPMYKDGLQVKKAAEQKLDESTQLESIGRLSSTTINAKIGISFLVIIAIVTVAIIIYEGTRTKTFPNPMFEGYRLDFCFSLGHECGNPVAVKWCQRQGYGEFVHFEPERVAGETKTFSGQICSNACDSFKSITCTLH